MFQMNIMYVTNIYILSCANLLYDSLFFRINKYSL